MSTIYLDMDGVVADFDALAQKIIGHTHEPNVRYPDSDWNKILAYPRFYKDLPLCTNAKHLVDSVQILAKHHGRDLVFLTAIPKHNDMPWAFSDKVEWARWHFPGVPVWFGPYSHDKQMYARDGEILIDDRRTNIEEWQEAGGQGILYTGSAELALQQLRSLL